jgi:hypothetical protein
VKLPQWFWIVLGIWALIGLPALILASLWTGGFDLIPDPPPYFKAPYEDRSFSANFDWVVAVALAYLPIFITPAAIIDARRRRKNVNA